MQSELSLECFASECPPFATGVFGVFWPPGGWIPYSAASVLASVTIHATRMSKGDSGTSATS